MLPAAFANAQTESISSIASAANTGTDQSMAALTQVFGSVMSSPLTGSSGSGSTIASILGTINACVLVIGALWACYLFFAAMIATGAEGEFLGQKRSSIWFTIRNGVGFTLLVPFTGGYSGAQLIMLWVTTMGIGIANLGMSAATSVLANGGTLVSTPPPPQVVTLAKALFEANLCAQAANTAATNVSTDTGGVSTDGGEQFSAKPTTGQIVLMNGNGLSCGGASVASNSAASSITTATSTTGLSSIVPNTSQITSTISAKQQSALTTMQSTLQSAAITYVSAVNAGKQPTDPQTTINSAATAYQSTIQGAISSASSSISSISSTIQSSLSTSGWVMLGAWYQAFAMANSQLTAAAAAAATAIPSTDISNLPYPDLYNEVMASYNQQIEQDASTTASSASISSSTTPVIGLYSNSPDPAHVIGSIFPGQRLVSMVTTLITSNSSSGTGTNPLMGMKTMGDYILDAGDGALAAYSIVSYGQGAADSVPGRVVSAVGDMFSGGAISGLSRVASNLSPIIIMMIVSLFFFGAVLSVYLPMLPFMIWFGGVLSWFACVCEGVVAAPLWALSHLDGEGEGMGPRTSYGYIFLVNLMLRPAFMVIGFLLASVGVVAFGQLLNTMFAQAMANAQFNSVTGVVSIIAYIVLYVGMCQTLCQTMFGLVHHIPNVMGSWLGTSMHNQFGHEMHDKGHTVLAGASNTSSQHVQRVIGGGKPNGNPTASGNAIVPGEQDKPKL
ncbi:DotA/TraY family protein [Paraburkholderia edwinii]|uniref:DotA/TraY family protein n=1 Tax=Paraburkholderia edwinii TaxID=2861782 RepID=A0ABX8UT37_9BURK|nr:DotA/TraY family protein [Paraburkholderia edwinii]QYD70075.1 DotA/TraY family protein [Paraburkholderia edwinii]